MRMSRECGSNQGGVALALPRGNQLDAAQSLWSCENN